MSTEPCQLCSTGELVPYCVNSNVSLGFNSIRIPTYFRTCNYCGCSTATHGDLFINRYISVEVYKYLLEISEDKML